MATQKSKTKPVSPSASIKEGIRRGEKSWPSGRSGKVKALSKGRIKKAALLDRVEKIVTRKS